MAKTDPAPGFAPARLTAAPRRPAAAWALLLLAWLVGLIVWAAYLAAIFYALWRWL